MVGTQNVKYGSCRAEVELKIIQVHNPLSATCKIHEGLKIRFFK